MLRLNIETIPEEGLKLNEVLDLPFLVEAADDDVFSPSQSGSLSLSIEKLGREVRINGKAQVSYRVTCVAGLDAFQGDFEIPIDLYLKPQTEVQDEADEIDDQTCGIDHYVEGEPIDISELVKEAINLALPLNPRCSDDCQGLCQTCGANLNHEKCACTPKVDSPFAVLSSLKVN